MSVADSWEGREAGTDALAHGLRWLCRTEQARIAHVLDHVLYEAERTRDVTLIGTGSEVDLAVRMRDRLKLHGIDAAVVSLPCWESFDDQSPAHRESVLGSAPRFAIEAALPFGWSRYVGSDENVFGVNRFGISGPGP